MVLLQLSDSLIINPRKNLGKFRSLAASLAHIVPSLPDKCGVLQAARRLAFRSRRLAAAGATLG